MSATRRSEEKGFTLVELMIATMVMAIIAGATLSVLYRTFKDTGIVTDRSAQQNDARNSLELMSKDIRQATSIVSPTGSNPAPNDLLDINTYRLNAAGTPVVTEVTWRLNGTDLQDRIGTGAYVTVASNVLNTTLLPPAHLFTYSSHSNTTDEVSISLQIGTKPSATIPFVTDVQIRNLDQSTSQ